MMGDGDGTRDARQLRAVSVLRDHFGEEGTRDPRMRLRMLHKEVVEACQAGGLGPDVLRDDVATTYARPAGELGQELGGVGLCLLAAAAAGGLSADEEELRELDRVTSLPPGHFAPRQAAQEAADAGEAARRMGGKG